MPIKTNKLQVTTEGLQVWARESRDLKGALWNEMDSVNDLQDATNLTAS